MNDSRQRAIDALVAYGVQPRSADDLVTAIEAAGLQIVDTAVGAVLAEHSRQLATLFAQQDADLAALGHRR